MAVSPEYREFVLEQLGRVAPVTARSMFGGVGIYQNGLFFALMDDDSLYFKVDDTNRPDFEAVGSGPFNPGGDPSMVMQYYLVPEELVEDPDRLRPWMDAAVNVALRARARKRPASKPKPKKS
jgi:DNA transformation protein